MTPSAVQGRCVDSLVAAEVRHACADCMPGCPAPPVRRRVRGLLQRAPTAALRDRAAGAAAVPRAADADGAAAPGGGGRDLAGAVPPAGSAAGGGGAPAATRGAGAAARAAQGDDGDGLSDRRRL